MTYSHVFAFTLGVLLGASAMCAAWCRSNNRINAQRVRWERNQREQIIRAKHEGVMAERAVRDCRRPTVKIRNN